MIITKMSAVRHVPNLQQPVSTGSVLCSNKKKIVTIIFVNDDLLLISLDVIAIKETIHLTISILKG